MLNSVFEEFFSIGKHETRCLSFPHMSFLDLFPASRIFCSITAPLCNSHFHDRLADIIRATIHGDAYHALVESVALPMYQLAEFTHPALRNVEEIF